VRVSVKVTPNAKKEEVVRQADIYLVKVKEAAKEGKANEAVVKLLSNYFRVPRSAIRIKSGFASRNKIVEVADS
jgi:uncharacterized protein (TIGR00251 family)